MTWKVSNRAYFKIIIMPYYCYSYHMSTRILPSQFAQSTNISKPYQCCTVWEYADYQLWRTRKDSIYQGEEVYLWYDIKRLSSLWKLLWMWRSVFLNINIYCKKKGGVILRIGYLSWKNKIDMYDSCCWFLIGWNFLYKHILLSKSMTIGSDASFST